MDVGGATHGGPRPSSRAARCSRGCATTTARSRRSTSRSSAPAERFRLPDGQTFGIIASTTQPFCRTCDRARLTADGVLLLCLYAQHGTDLRRPLRAGASRETLRRSDSKPSGRAAPTAAPKSAAPSASRGAFIPVSVLKRDAHLEMHTRGG